jgi:hypothetical protein
MGLSVLNKKIGVRIIPLISLKGVLFMNKKYSRTTLLAPFLRFVTCGMTHHKKSDIIGVKDVKPDSKMLVINVII